MHPCHFISTHATLWKLLLSNPAEFFTFADSNQQVSAVSTSKTGKHGHAKCNFTAIDIFTGKKYEDIIPSTHTAHVPFVVRKDYSLVDISSDEFCSLMDDEGNCREDVKLPDYPDNFGREIKTAFEAGKSLMVSVLSAMGHDQIVAMKEDADK
jgi:translation initiation factor 5A